MGLLLRRFQILPRGKKKQPMLSGKGKPGQSVPESLHSMASVGDPWGSMQRREEDQIWLPLGTGCQGVWAMMTWLERIVAPVMLGYLCPLCPGASQPSL